MWREAKAKTQGRLPEDPHPWHGPEDMGGETLEQQGRHREGKQAGSQGQAWEPTHPASCSVTAHFRLESGWICPGVSTWQLWPAMAEGTFIATRGKSLESSKESDSE